MRLHYTHSYLLNPTHRITVNLIGCGGTGTKVLSGLTSLNEALTALGHPGLMVTVYDDDRVSDANIGRQLFSPQDIGYFKAVVAVTRINRYFGYDWQAVSKKYNTSLLKSEGADAKANITITCVDTAKARIEIGKLLKPAKYVEPNRDLFYWMDYGNLQKTGQVVLGTITPSDVDNGSIKSLATVTQLFDLTKVKEKKQGPSCSLAEALGKQDLFINPALADLGLNLLWKLFREARIANQGCYMNLDTMNVNPIKI